ncbi:MAG: hypothetical protein O3B09_03040, partial [Proteobacteria bacterium]|nr:hypothetical protein [Pseudomonadota bacterium]
NFCAENIDKENIPEQTRLQCLEELKSLRSKSWEEIKMNELFREKRQTLRYVMQLRMADPQNPRLEKAERRLRKELNMD